MPTAITMDELKQQVEKYATDEPELIAILTQVGIGTHNAPTKKNKFFKFGDVRIPASALKEEYQNSVLPKEVNIKTLAFIPRSIASDELLHLIDDVDQVSESVDD
jgi:hypothetical protein